MRYIKLFEEFGGSVISSNFNYWIEILNKLGYKGVSPLQGGHFGFCFLTDESKVVKITFDKGDAVAAYILKNKKNEYLVDYYKSYILNIKDLPKKNIYVVEMEYLSSKPDSIKLKKAFDIQNKSFGDISKIYLIHPNSYVRDLFKIKKEAALRDVKIDFQNSGNFLIKNGHLCGVDIGYDPIKDNYWKILEKLPVVEI